MTRYNFENSLVGVITLVLVGLKATGTINWSWWAVMAPMLIFIGLGLLGVIIGLVVVAIAKRNARK